MSPQQSIEEWALLRLVRAGLRAGAAAKIAAEFDALAAERMVQAMGRFAAKEKAREALTAAEFEVLELVVSGMNDGEIAQALGISSSAVQQRKASGKARLNAKTTVQAAVLLFADRAEPQISTGDERAKMLA